MAIASAQGATIHYCRLIKTNSPKMLADRGRAIYSVHTTASFVIGIASMALSSSNGFAQWAYGIGQLHHARHGKTNIRKG
jgi:hypothetical protein